MKQNDDDPFIMVHVDHDGSVLAKWEPLIFFDVTHGGFFEPLKPLIFEARAEKEQSRNISRTIRLYRNGKPSTGGQWHHELETAFLRAEYVAAAYIYRRKAMIENQHKMVRYK